MNNKTLNRIYGVVVVTLLVITFAIVWHKKTAKTPMQRYMAGDTNALPTYNFKQIRTSKPAAKFTAEEKTILNELFVERFKPAIDRWASAYAGHLPFDANEITLDKFHSTGNGNYTFMLGDTTFTIFNGRKGAKVFYMMTRQAAKDLNSFPTDGKPRNLTVPITREEVLKMAEADTGLHYELKDIVINPTAKFSNIDGGAEVQVGIKYNGGMMLMDPNNLLFVVGPDGKLVTYQH